MVRESLLFFASIILIAGCSGTSAPVPSTAEVEAPSGTSARLALVSQVQIGDSRERVEALLGQPMQVQRSAEGTQAMYMLGMEGMMAQVNSAMANAQRASAVQGIADTALGALGMLGGPAGSVAAGVGGGILSLGSSLATTASMPEMPSMDQMRMVTIDYRMEKVFTVQVMNPAQMGGMQPLQDE